MSFDSGYKGGVSYANFFIVGHSTAMGYFQSLSPLVEQCMADSISNRSESEEVAD